MPIIQEYIIWFFLNRVIEIKAGDISKAKTTKTPANFTELVTVKEKVIKNKISLRKPDVFLLKKRIKKPSNRYIIAVLIIDSWGVKMISEAIKFWNSSVPWGDFDNKIKTAETPKAYNKAIKASKCRFLFDAKAIKRPVIKEKAKDIGYRNCPDSRKIDKAAPNADIWPTAKSVKIIPRLIISIPK